MYRYTCRNTARRLRCLPRYTPTAAPPWLLAAIAVLGLIANGASAREIQLASEPAVSPDGSELAFSYAGDIWTVPSDGGIAKRLTIHPAREHSPIYSPDGSRIAFVSDRTGADQVFIVEQDERVPRQITFHSEGFRLQDWAPDGQSILTLARRDHHWKRTDRFFEINTEKRQAERIVFDAYGQDGRWSPDGKKLLFTREGERWWRKGYVGSRASQVWLYNTEDQSFTQLLAGPYENRSPLWKPNGSGFYFVTNESGSFNLWEYNLESQKTKQLTQFHDDSVVMPALSRDGKTLVFRHLFDLYTIDPRKNKPPRKLKLVTSGDDPIETSLRRTLSSASDVTFTPDGLEMVFSAGGDLWAMDTVLKEPVPITQSEVEEREPVFVEDGQALLYLKEENGQVDVYRAEPAHSSMFWWQNHEFKTTRLTNDAATEVNLRLSPDGQHFAVTKEPGDLWLMKLDGSPVHKLVSGFDIPSFDFSPDGKWIVYSQADNDFNDEIWIVPTDLSREPYNVSRHPDDDVTPVWSPDGKTIAFVGRRTGEEWDIYYLFLNAKDDETSARDKKLKEAIEKLKKARQKPTNTVPKPKTEQQTDSQKQTKDTEKKHDTSEPENANDADKSKPEPPKVTIDFEDIENRLHRVSIPNVNERGLFWLGDGKTLAFTATIDGQRGTYTIEINERLSPKKLTASTGSHIQRLKSKDTVGWLSSGKPGTLSAKGATTSFTFSAKQEQDISQRFQAGFDVAWRLMRDNWYDDRFGNRNWSEIRRKYQPAAGHAPDDATFADVVSLMLGELNGSHLGYYSRSSSSYSRDGWNQSTAHLGVRFDRQYLGPGLKVKDVVSRGPADRQGSRIHAGEIIVSVDGTPVDPAMDLTLLLNGQLDRDIVLRVRNPAEEERDVTIRPVSYSQIRSLLYPQFEEETRQKVIELSQDKLGYIHIQGMNTASFREFERQLYNAGYGKDGLVIDVRENGGGSTTDHLLTVLTQPRHAITVPRGGGRGYPHDRKIYATWNKPIIVLCNQNSFSNAEIFSHAIKTLGRGKVVGVTTAGGVISTGAASVMDMGTLRQPFRGWFLLNGEDMELNGARPNLEIWPLPGELPQGKDRQLEAAVAMLLDDLKKIDSKTEVPLRRATERDVQPAVLRARNLNQD